MEIPKYVPFMFDLSGKAFIDSIDLANILCEKHSTVCLWIEDYIINGNDSFERRRPFTVKLSVDERGKVYNSYFINKEIFDYIGNKFYLSEATKQIRQEHRQTICELLRSFCYMEAIA